MRIIAGQHRGRKLLSPRGRGTRPITDRAKTALFSILAPRVQDARVVDLFCGTGSLGLEALSRGAAWCGFAERDAAAVQRLRRNIQAMGVAGRCRIWQGDAMRRLPRWLDGLDAPVDLAFVDPPYALAETWSWSYAVDRLFEPLGRRLAETGLAVFRCPGNLAVPDALGPLRVRDARRYGRMGLVFLMAAAVEGRQ